MVIFSVSLLNITINKIRKLKSVRESSKRSDIRARSSSERKLGRPKKNKKNDLINTRSLTFSVAQHAPKKEVEIIEYSKPF